MANEYKMDMGSHGKAEVTTLKAALDELAGKTTADRDEMVIYDISGHAVDEDDDLAELEDDGLTGRVALIWASHDEADKDDGSHAIGEVTRVLREDEAGEAPAHPRMTVTEAEAWVREWLAMDETRETLMDGDDLEAAFAAIMGRAPDDDDREEGLWSHLCAAVDTVEPVEEPATVSEVHFTGQLKPDGGTYRIRVSTDDARAIGVEAGDRVHITMRRAE